MAVPVDCQLSDSFQFLSGLGNRDHAALLVRDPGVVHFMRMAVDHHIQAGQFSDNRVARIDRGGFRITAEVGEQDHVIRSVCPDFIDTLLQGVAQPVPGIVHKEVIHRFADFVHDIPDTGLGKSIRRNRCDKSDFQVTGFQDLPGAEYRLTVGGAEIRAGIAAGKQLGTFLQRIKAEIKFMVSGSRKVISRPVHHPDDLRAIGKGSDDGSLHGVAGIHEKDVIIKRFQFLFIQDKPVITDIVRISRVNIVGVENHSRHLIRGSGRKY